MKEGATDAVKVEGGNTAAHIIRAIVNAGIPVMGHIGLTPQYMSLLGGYKAQGTDVKAAKQIINDALSVEAAGAFAIILECIPDQISSIVTKSLQIPTISYGAGASCDGQGLVAHDILGMFDRFTPKFVKRYARLGEDIQEAFKDYISDVVEGHFPLDEHSFHIKKAYLDQIIKEAKKN